MAEKGKSRGAGAKSKPDKTRTPVRGQSKKTLKTLGRTPSPDEAPQEPLDVGPILDDLLDRVLTECALAAAARKRVPFTVSRARDAILFVAEWEFLVRDNGDPDRAGDPDPERDGVWSEDEEPQTSHWNSSTPGVVPVHSEEVPSEDLPVSQEGSLDALFLLDVPVSPREVPAATPTCHSRSAAAAASSAEPLGAVTSAPCPKPPVAPRPPGRGRLLSRRPRARPPAPPSSTVPSQPRAQAPQETRRGTVAVGDRVPPAPPSSRLSFAWVPPRRSPRGTGVPRQSARRDAVRWLLPEVRVIDVTNEPDRVRSVGSRSRLIPAGTRYVAQAAARTPRGEPQLCDPWLASARLAPGVTVRWGNSERRGPAPAGHGAQGDGEQEDDEAMGRARKELKPILPTPESRISEFVDAEEQLENPPAVQQLPGAVPVPGLLPAVWGPSAPRAPWVPELPSATAPSGTPEYRGSLPVMLRKNQK